MKNQNTLQEMKNNRLTFWFDKKQVKLNSILFKWDTISLFKLTFFQHAINNSEENNSTKQFSELLCANIFSCDQYNHMHYAELCISAKDRKERSKASP